MQADEFIVVNGNITVTILEAGNSVRLAIKAPRSIEVHSAEVYQCIVGTTPGQAAADEPDTMEVVE